MAGKQFSFFLGPADEVAFEDIIRSSGDIAFLRVWPKSPEPEELATSCVLRMGEEILNILIARRVDIPEIDFQPVPGRDVFSCDPEISPVIEFGRCYQTKRFIRVGRLYRIDEYWDAQNLRSKPQAFIDWGERLFSIAKASLTKVEQGCFAGPEALEMRQSGIAFEGLDIEVGPSTIDRLSSEMVTCSRTYSAKPLGRL